MNIINTWSTVNPEEYDCNNDPECYNYNPWAISSDDFRSKDYKNLQYAINSYVLDINPNTKYMSLSTQTNPDDENTSPNSLSELRTPDRTLIVSPPKYIIETPSKKEFFKEPKESKEYQSSYDEEYTTSNGFLLLLYFVIFIIVISWISNFFTYTRKSNKPPTNNQLKSTNIVAENSKNSSKGISEGSSEITSSNNESLPPGSPVNTDSGEPQFSTTMAPGPAPLG